MTASLELALHALESRALGVGDAPALQNLFERCRAYFAAADRRGPSKHAALERIADGLDDERIRMFGFTAGKADELSGFLELRLDEPEPDAATIVLLLLDPKLRRRGFGQEIVEASAAALGRAGFRSLHLGVQAHERQAHAFWAALGFTPEERIGSVTAYMRML